METVVAPTHLASAGMEQAIPRSGSEYSKNQWNQITTLTGHWKLIPISLAPHPRANLEDLLKKNQLMLLVLQKNGDS